MWPIVERILKDAFPVGPWCGLFVAKTTSFQSLSFIIPMRNNELSSFFHSFFCLTLTPPGLYLPFEISSTHFAEVAFVLENTCLKSLADQQNNIEDKNDPCSCSSTV